MVMERETSEDTQYQDHGDGKRNVRRHPHQGFTQIKSMSQHAMHSSHQAMQATALTLN